MSETEKPSALRRAILRTAWRRQARTPCYDQDDARSRIAREFYGTEELPLWWHTVRSITCFAEALAVLLGLLRSGVPRSLCIIAVIDRYLPVSCPHVSDDRPDPRPKPWDQEECESAHEVRERVEGTPTTLRTEVRS